MLYKSNIFAQASGSLDGTVFSHNQFGRYTRNRTIPTNPNTARQQGVRANFGVASSVWSSVASQAQRDAWDVFAANIPTQNRVGETIFLTGFHHFVGSNTARLVAGLGAVLAAPVILSLPPRDATFSILATTVAQLLVVNFDTTEPWVEEDGAGLLVSMGLPQPPSRTFFATPYRFAGTILGDSISPQTSPQVFAAPFVLGANQRVWARARIATADARISTFMTDDTETEL